MKTERYYDVGCEECGRHLSTDFFRGWASSRKQAEAWAKQEGFRVVDGRTLCPFCVKQQNNNK